MTSLIKNKRGLMDDFTDLLSLVLILSMLGFFAVVVLRTDAGDKNDRTLERIASFQGQEALLEMVNYPMIFETKEVIMKDIIFLAVNANDEALFTEKMQAYFEQRQIEGAAAVYDSVSYGVDEDPEPLLSYNNVVFMGDEKGVIYLTNADGTGNKKNLVVKLFG